MTKKTIEKQMPLAGTEEGEILAKLNERVEKAVKLIQDLRRERDELKAKLAEAEGVGGQRQEIRARIEGILATLENLDE